VCHPLEKPWMSRYWRTRLHHHMYRAGACRRATAQAWSRILGLDQELELELALQPELELELELELMHPEAHQTK